MCGKGSGVRVGVGVGADDGSGFFPACAGEGRSGEDAPEPEVDAVPLRLLLKVGITSSKGSSRTGEVAPLRESPSRLLRGDNETGAASLTAGDARCSILLSFGSSGEMVDRVGARTATDVEEEVGTERDGGGGADFGVAGGIVAERVALLRDGGGLKTSNSKDGERTRFRFVFDDGAGFGFVAVSVAVVVAEETTASAATAATSGTTSFSGRSGDD